MSSNLQNSIWPNTDGNLGNIKVQIPDGVTTPWPTGDALINNFVYHNGKLVGLVDTKALIANSSKSTTFPYEYVNISLPSIAEGEMTYNHDQCVYFILNGKVIKWNEESDIPSDEELEIITKKYAGCKTVDEVKAVDPNYQTTDIVDGVWKEGLGDLEDGISMFYNCTNLTSFNSDLSSLTDGHGMFSSCDNLASFYADLSSLTDGRIMFITCSNLTKFSSNLPNLTTGEEMFKYCSALASFSSDLPSLTTGEYMFAECEHLTSFNSDLSSLSYGYRMFLGCSALETFTSDLSSLTNGFYMFYGCKLDTDSIKNIAETINDVSSLTNGKYHYDDVYKVLYLDIGHQSPSDEELTYIEQIQEKGWTVYANGSEYTGSSGYYSYAANASLASSTMNLDEMGETEMFNPIPYWAKPVPSDEQHAKYVDSQGNFYNILGAQFIYGDNLETYGMFTCEEDAATNMGLTKIEK